MKAMKFRSVYSDDIRKEYVYNEFGMRSYIILTLLCCFSSCVFRSVMIIIDFASYTSCGSCSRLPTVSSSLHFHCYVLQTCTHINCKVYYITCLGNWEL